MQMHHSAADAVRGLRPVTPALLRAEELASRWRGLPLTGSKSQLLQLLEDVSSEAMEISKGARLLAHWYVKKQPKDCFRRLDQVNVAQLDRQGLSLISTYPDAYVAAALDVTTRTLARWRAELAQAGWIAFRDAPDRSRYRLGTPENPDDAFGVDLRPLIVRYEELQALAKERFDAIKILLGLRRDLSRRRNRLRSLLAIYCDTPPADTDLVMAEIERVRRSKSAARYTSAIAAADDIIRQLEQGLTCQAAVVSRVTETSCAPDDIGAQLNPTKIPSKNLKEGCEMYAARCAADVSPPSDPVDDVEDVVWCSSDYQEPTVPVIEVEASVARRKPSAGVVRVSCPSAEDVLRALPALLSQIDLVFTEHPAIYPTPRALATAYGQASAFRLGMEIKQIESLTLLHGPMPFAVASLLAEFTNGVDNRRGYLHSLLQRLADPSIKVDLWASWQRLARQFRRSPLAFPC